jgi:hypothetical protein
MKNITSVAGLKNAIQLLEDEQAGKGQLLKEQFYITYNSFKPGNLLGGTLKEMVSSPYLIENIIDTTISIATGYLAKKIVVGASSNMIRRLLGSVMQLGVTNLVTKHPDTIKRIGQFVFQRFFHKKEMDSKKL